MANVIDTIPVEKPTPHLIDTLISVQVIPRSGGVLNNDLMTKYVGYLQSYVTELGRFTFTLEGCQEVTIDDRRNRIEIYKHVESDR